MLSLLDLPPEIRLVIYHILLQSALTKRTRILYTGDDPLRCKGCPDSVRRRQPYHFHQGRISLSGDKTIHMWEIEEAKHKIHLADIDDLLLLASTCRLLRPEILAIAWSNADILVRSPKISTDLHCIFYDRLSSNTCSFIRTLQIQVDHGTWSPQEMRRTAALIRRRLPQLEQLTVNISVMISHTRTKIAMRVRNAALAELQGLPSQISVKFAHYIAPRCYPAFMKYGSLHGLRDFQKRWNGPADRYLHNLRIKVNLVGQKRREALAKKEQGDEVGDILDYGRDALSHG